MPCFEILKAFYIHVHTEEASHGRSEWSLLVTGLVAQAVVTRGSCGKNYVIYTLSFINSCNL